MQNLREKESLLLGKMLTLSSAGNFPSQRSWSIIGADVDPITLAFILLTANAGNADFNDQWKVLIYDKDCRDIISPLLNVGALRQKGVTLHMEVLPTLCTILYYNKVICIMSTDYFGARACTGCSCRILRAPHRGKYQTHCRGLRQTGAHECALLVI